MLMSLGVAVHFSSDEYLTDLDLNTACSVTPTLQRPKITHCLSLVLSCRRLNTINSSAGNDPLESIGRSGNVHKLPYHTM